MQLFDIISPDFFKPLTGINHQKYADIITMIWFRCKRTPLYGESKNIMLDWLEDYFSGLNEDIPLDSDEIVYNEVSDGVQRTPRFWAAVFLRRLKSTGWLEEREGGYEEETQIVVNHRIVPIIRSFSDVISPQMVTYKGKLFKIYKLLKSVSEADSPYESVLREVSGDLDELNAALRQLAASIGTYVDELTRGKTPEEVLLLFDTYEEKVVVGAYHRFKTNDNLFYYKSELFEQLELCRTQYFEALVKDFSTIEQVSDEEAALAIGRLVFKLEDDLKEISEIMKIIDERHILYRSRAVQRAQFLLLSDGTVKSKVNRILQYCVSTIVDVDSLQDFGDEKIGSIFQMFPQWYFDEKALKPPILPRKPTPIGELEEQEELDPEVIAQRQEQLFRFVRNAVTAENVNRFAQSVLKEHQVTTAQALVAQYQASDDLVKIIGLHTYSSSAERTYEIAVKPSFVTCNGLKFQDFSVRKRG